MNLSEALDAALPEIPQTRLARTRPPRLDPDLVIREDVLDGEPTVGILQRETANFFRFTPGQWTLAQLFDGNRSYEEIAELFTAQSGIPLQPAEAKAFAENMDESNFWHKTAQEKNLALSEKLMAQRGRRGRSKIDFAHISFSAWDPDRYFDWLNAKIGGYVYSRWCVMAVVLLFAFETGIFISKWSVLGPDTIMYFNFTRKSLMDIAQFWVLVLILGFCHESAHGLTCKHFGGQVHSMGFMLIYLSPAVYVDITEVWVAASKVQRLAAIIAGIWIEMVLCGMAMVVWVNTRTGQWLHDFSYQLILLTGFAIALINLNPLIKLDGYYFFTELIEIPDLKERSTAFLSGWVQSRILRLPVQVPVVPRRRVPLLVVYAALSGIYSYTLLFFAVRFAYNVAAHWMAELAVIPAAAFAFVVFRSRLRSLGKVLRRTWDHNFDESHRWRPIHVVIFAAVASLLFLPIWRDRVDAYYVVEPLQSRTLHASVPGRIDRVMVQDGETVHAGQPLLQMSSPAAASMQSVALAETGSARFQAYNAQLKGQSIGPAAARQAGAAHLAAIAHDARSSLVIAAPADGIIVTRNPRLLLDANVGTGQSLLELADAGPRLIRIFIPVSALDRVPQAAEVAFSLPGQFAVLHLPLASPGGSAQSLPAGLSASQDYKGIELGTFYVSRMTLAAATSDPLFGASGPAKIFGVRRSMAERMFFILLNVVKAHVW
ncbi:MAG TPA: biotin/lipoyl-binding protein [Terracidiphilus sp.]|nr:biotin/lipoyl-binding protein [Terracidiphilus sp.]